MQNKRETPLINCPEPCSISVFSAKSLLGHFSSGVRLKATPPSVWTATTHLDWGPGEGSCLARCPPGGLGFRAVVSSVCPSKWLEWGSRTPPAVLSLLLRRIRIQSPVELGHLAFRQLGSWWLMGHFLPEAKDGPAALWFEDGKMATTRT